MSTNQLSLGMVLSMVDKLTGPLKKVVDSVGGIGTAAEKAAGKFTKLQNQVDKLAKNAKQLDAVGKPLVAAGAAGAAGIAVTVAAFADLEEAQNRLKTNLMDSTGKVGSEFDKLNKLAEKLGTDLPGSTKDMVEMFNALREQGVQTNMILGGYGEAAAKFATVMKVPFAEAATHVAKFSESMGIADKDATEFMDTIQRLKGASGVETGDLAYTFKYAGGALKLLNLQGIEAAKSFSTVVGVLAGAGIEGSTAGTNMAAALGRMAEIGHRLDRGQVKKMVGPILDKYKIDLQFFDGDGKFKGLREMVGELEKMKSLNPQEQIIVLKKLFGDEAARPLAVLLKSGVAGFDAMAKRMKDQADMQAKIKQIMSGTKMQWETMTGTAANMVAHVGAVFAKVVNLPAVFSKLNDLFAKMDEWVLAHPKTAATIGSIVVAATALATVGGGLLMGIAAIGAGIGPFIGGLAALSKVIGFVSMAFRALTLSMLTNPFVLAAAGVVTAGVLIYKYWGPIKSFFKGIGSAIVGTFNRIATTARTGFAWIAGNWQKVLKVFLMVSPLTAPFLVLNELVKKVSGLNLFQAGANIFKTLVSGMKSMVSKPAEIMRSVVQKMRNFLPFSPAKEGPFRDIHRVKIIETIAGAMKPAPMVAAMRTATAATMLATMSAPAIPQTAAAATMKAAIPQTAAASGGVSVNFSPTINLAPGTPAETRQQVDQALATSQAELERMIERIVQQKQRRAF